MRYILVTNLFFLLKLYLFINSLIMEFIIFSVDKKYKLMIKMSLLKYKEKLQNYVSIKICI